ncbi:MAG: hypothetical protein ABSC05_13965 [Candidatus Solibacter sp.]
MQSRPQRHVGWRFDRPAEPCINGSLYAITRLADLGNALDASPKMIVTARYRIAPGYTMIYRV